MIHDLEKKEEFPRLPLTPSKPSMTKKPALSQFSADNLKTDVTKLAHLINTRAAQGKIKDLKEKLGSIERHVEISEQSTLTVGDGT